MSNVRFTGLLALCAALAACSDSPQNRGVTAPDVGPALTEAAADQAFIPLAGGDAVGITEQIGPEQAATGGRASGHFEIDFGGGATEEASFIALSTAPPPPFAAKGEVEWRFRSATTTLRIHVNVTCLSIVGNDAWFSGPIEKFILNNQPVQPFLPNAQWRVRDNGEGASSPPDMASQGFYAFSPQDCQFRIPFFLFPSTNGNIQVRQ
jgi:hypothetical protein